MRQVFLVVALLAEIDLVVLQNIDDHRDKEWHALELVVLPFELRIFFLEIFGPYFLFKKCRLKFVQLDLVFELVLRVRIIDRGLFHITHISASSTIYVV